MATEIEITEPKLGIFVPVPPVSQPGVCEVCHGPTNERWGGGYFPTCYSCDGLDECGTRLVVPISLVHTAQSQLYTALKDYKSDGLPARVRNDHSLLIAATLQRFLRGHREHIEGAAGVGWDTITVVPSTRRRPPHPLETTIGRAPRIRDSLKALLTATGKSIGRNELVPEAFDVSPDAHGRSVLVVDDTFTSSSHVQSAVCALARAGVTVVAAVPVGRVVRTNRAENRALWEAQRRKPFSFDVCCLE